MPAAAAPMPAPIPRPPRDLRLDIVRGWMQVSIFVSHVVGSVFAWGIHAHWGISDSSEQFVFLSGLTLGSVFALKASRGGFAAAQADLGWRTLALYRTHLTVMVLFAVMLLLAERLIPLPGELERLGWCWLVEAPWFAVPAAATMLWQPDFMGILPVFVWCMLLLGPFMWLVARWGALALVPSALLYAAVQVGLVATPSLAEWGIAFDPLAWQFIFLLGAYLGRRALLAGEALPRRRWMLVLAGAVVAVGLWVQLVAHGMLPGPEEAAQLLLGKEVLAPARLVHALALAWLVAALVPREAGWMEGPVPQALATIGRHSLRVFCVGLFLAWGASTALARWPQHAAWLDPMLILGGAAVLLGVALAAERQRLRTRPARAAA